MWIRGNDELWRKKMTPTIHVCVFFFCIIFTLRKHRKPPFFVCFLLLSHLIRLKGINEMCKNLVHVHTYTHTVHTHIASVLTALEVWYLCVIFFQLVHCPNPIHYTRETCNLYVHLLTNIELIFLICSDWIKGLLRQWYHE